ncbi:hypothetical protein GW17_00026775 [Ensete ventricosum]|nr:hypothetical protein GW17_00026775 [Ensete ventricosum]
MVVATKILRTTLATRAVGASVVNSVAESSVAGGTTERVRTTFRRLGMLPRGGARGRLPCVEGLLANKLREEVCAALGVPSGGDNATLAAPKRDQANGVLVVGGSNRSAATRKAGEGWENTRKQLETMGRRWLQIGGADCHERGRRCYRLEEEKAIVDGREQPSSVSTLTEEEKEGSTRLQNELGKSERLTVSPRGDEALPRLLAGE